MTSFKQIAANRCNASKSTGPRTEEGKRRSRRNAVRHGLAAETVIGALEDAEDYQAFEAAITADYDAQSAVERELVLRLASLLWRLRRAAAIETGLFAIQADQLSELTSERQIAPTSRQIVYALFMQASTQHDQESVSSSGIAEPETNECNDTRPAGLTAHPSADLARCFLRLANLPNFTIDRLSRYEATLWRQLAQTLFALDTLDRRKPQERGRRFIRHCTHDLGPT
jgi:hypothetical protein